MAREQSKQLVLHLPTWGGKRRGAGRKRTGPRPRVDHRSRGVKAGRFPVLVTLRLRPEWRGLREPRLLASLRGFIASVNALGVVRIVEYCFLDDHLHLVVEAADAPTLARGLQGFAVRFARLLHDLHGRTGKILADRYHARDLRTPREVRAALAYVLNNARHHVYPLRDGALDLHSSAPWSPAIARTSVTHNALVPGIPPTRPPRTFLLAVAWAKHHPRIDTNEVPGPLHPALRRRKPSAAQS